MKAIMDGCAAATHVAYAFGDICTIYPISPVAEMGEIADRWADSGRKNIFGNCMVVKEMESELGAAGAAHGALCGGALATTFTNSQGLMLMIPNIYRMAGEMLPAVFHVGTRTVGTHALTIFGDHSDVMACRSTGVAMLASCTVQEAHDMAVVAHLSAIDSSLPFMHFFDGWRTGNQTQTLEISDYSDFAKIIDYDKVKEFRAKAMDPEKPMTRGTAQNPDIYFQTIESRNRFYDVLPGIVEKNMQKLKQITGRSYGLVEYYGDPDAEYVTVSMASSSSVIRKTVDYLNARGYKVGHINVRLFRPFPAEQFVKLLPQNVKVIAALDRCKDPAAQGEPLLMDVCTALAGTDKCHVKVIGGRYGIGSKDFSPAMVKAIFDEMSSASPRKRFTVGIDDDVTGLSLQVQEFMLPRDNNMFECIYYGMGADGTVSAQRLAATLISSHTSLNAQAFFQYSAKKSGGYTISQLRLSKDEIKSDYMIERAAYVCCNKDTYVNKYALVEHLDEGGVFILNSSWSDEELEKRLPASLKRAIAAKKAKFFNLDAVATAARFNLGTRINLIMEAAMFKISGIMPYDQAIGLLKDYLSQQYAKEGKQVIENNFNALDHALDTLREVHYPAQWIDCIDNPVSLSGLPQWIAKVAMPMNRLEGSRLPVSLMTPDGVYISGTTRYEKRCIAINVPLWDPQKCVQCAECSLVCAHAAIRPYVADAEELANAPQEFVTAEAKGTALKGKRWRIQVYPEDCTGCGSCSLVCPGHALSMQPLATQLSQQKEMLDFAQKHVSLKSGLLPRFSINGSQLYQPLLEFSGACGGCGETPYAKLVTQLFGEHMIIANATGCSSIWGADSPSQSYCANQRGHGPSWGNSLFEDNAEYAFGIYTAINYRRKNLESLIDAVIADKTSDTSLVAACRQWKSVKDDYDKSWLAGLAIRELLKKNPQWECAGPILADADLLGRKSVWAFGGDGWAYDIGFAGLDHVMASGENVNVLVMDTQCYSNTGGQTSKATPYSACMQFDFNGKRTFRKNLAQMMLTYRNVYVATIAIGGSMSQTIEALKEAEAYEGPSIVIAYCPCIEHGLKAGQGHSILEEREAVRCGFWPLFRYNPSVPAGTSPLTIDTPEDTNVGDIEPWLMGENRFAVLPDRVGATIASTMFEELKHHLSSLPPR